MGGAGCKPSLVTYCYTEVFARSDAEFAWNCRNEWESNAGQSFCPRRGAPLGFCGCSYSQLQTQTCEAATNASSDAKPLPLFDSTATNRRCALRNGLRCGDRPRC